jgi:hypothetical protein
MPEMRSVARQLRLRAEQGATREELELELRGDGTLSRLERAVLEAYVWALVRTVARAHKGGGERRGPGP